MGASVQPVQAGPGDPQDIARVQGNVAKMRSMNAPESDVLAYLQHEDAQSKAITAPGPDTSINARNLLRSAGQGATFGMGDKLGLSDPDAQKAFANAHPWINGITEAAAGSVAPFLATLAAPELLGGAAGAATLGAASGVLNGVGQPDASATATDRLKSGAVGGAVGAPAALAGYGVAKTVGAGLSALLDRLNPSRAVARGAADLVTPADEARMAQINAQAPGTASIATATTPPKVPGVTNNSRFLSMVRGVGANPKAAAAVEQHLLTQNGAIEQAKGALGSQMDALNTDVPMTPKLRAAMDKVRTALGGKTPELPDKDYRLVTAATPDEMITTAQSPHPDLRTAINDFWSRPGIAFDRKEGTVAQQMAKQALDRHITEGVVSPSLTGSPTVVPGRPAVMAPETVDLQTLRDALGRLRYMARNAAKRGTEANGPTTYEIASARNALQSVLYKHAPQLGDLDTQYGTMMDQQRQVNKLLNTVRLSRQNYAGNAAFKASSGSLGGSLPSGRAGVAMNVIDKLLTDKAGAADAIARGVVRPGSAAFNELMRNLPRPHPFASAAPGPLSAATVPAMRGLLFPQDQQ